MGWFEIMDTYFTYIQEIMQIIREIHNVAISKKAKDEHLQETDISKNKLLKKLFEKHTELQSLCNPHNINWKIPLLHILNILQKYDFTDILKDPTQIIDEIILQISQQEINIDLITDNDQRQLYFYFEYIFELLTTSFLCFTDKNPSDDRSNEIIINKNCDNLSQIYEKFKKSHNETYKRFDFKLPSKRQSIVSIGKFDFGEDPKLVTKKEVTKKEVPSFSYLLLPFNNMIELLKKNRKLIIVILMQEIKHDKEPKQEQRDKEHEQEPFVLQNKYLKYKIKYIKLKELLNNNTN
jgi:hypothetical protein